MEQKQQEETIKDVAKKAWSLEKMHYAILVVNILSMCMAVATLIMIVLSK